MRSSSAAIFAAAAMQPGHWGLADSMPGPPRSTLEALYAWVARRQTTTGVIYDPNTPSSSHVQSGTQEWQDAIGFDPSVIAKFSAVVVEGDSLDPIARGGQHVPVDARRTATNVFPGSIAVIETEDVNIGNVIKKVIPMAADFVLVSTNPVDSIAPILLPRNRLKQMFSASGILFNPRLE